MPDRLGRNILMVVALVAFTLADTASGDSEEDVVQEDVAPFEIALDPSEVNAEDGEEFVVAVVDPADGERLGTDLRLVVEHDERLELVEIFDVNTPDVGDIEVNFVVLRCAEEGENLKIAVEAEDEFDDTASAMGTANCLAEGAVAGDEPTGDDGLDAACDLDSSDADCQEQIADCAAGVGDGCGELIDECAAGATDGVCEQILAQCDDPDFDAACQECIAEGTCGEGDIAAGEDGDTDVPTLQGPQAALVGGWRHPDGSSIILSAEGEIDVTTPDGEEATGTFEVSGTTIIIDVPHPLWEACSPEPATFDWFINEEDGWLQLSPFPGDCFDQLAFFARGVVDPDQDRFWSRDDESGPVVEAQGGTIGFTMDLSGGTCSQYASSYSQTVELTADPAPAAPGQWIVVMVIPESGQAVQSDPWDASSGDPLVMVFDGEYSEVYTYNPATGTFEYDYTDENGQDCAWTGEIPDSQEFQDFDDFLP